MKLGPACGAALAALALAAPASAEPLPGAPDCELFPATNVWNKRVDTLPIREDSRRIVNSIGANLSLHPDFGSGLWNGGPIGIPVTIVDSSTPGSAVDFEYADESDAGPYPIPDDVAIEGGPDAEGDRHALIVDRESCTLYELRALPLLVGRLRRALEPGVQRSSPPRLDLRRRRGAPDPARPRALRRGRGRRDRPRSPLHRAPLAPGLRLPGPTLREPKYESRPSADGVEVAAEKQLSPPELPAPGPRRPPSAQALRDDRGRQRLELVRLGRAGPQLGTTSCTRCIA